MSFKLPPNHQQLYAEVYSRCLALIDLGYWTRIDKSILDDWLSNFTNKEEKFFAIQILFHFKFRNNKTIISMFNQIIQVLLPQKLEELNIYKINSISDWEKTLKTSDKELFKLPFRFSTINKKGAIGESGDALFRLMAQKNILNKKLGRFIDSITSECKVVILIDDITGSGGQFIDFFNRYKENFNQFDYIIYAPLIAHIEAIDKLTKLDNRIHIITSEILTKEECFSKTEKVVKNS